MARPAMPDARHRLSAPKWLVLALLVALAPAAARADQGNEHAKQLFEQGRTLFDVGEFDKAIEAWQQAYKEKTDPLFLYNIAQAYRLKGDNQKAIFFYRGYLRNAPKAANKAEVEGKIAQLQKAAEGKPGAPTTPTPAPAPTPISPAPVSPAPISTPTPVRPAPVPVPAPGPGPVGPTPVAPPPVDAPPLAGAGGPPPVAEFVAPPAPLPPLRNRPLDFGLAMGLNAWTSGLRGKVEPSFSLDFGAGYSLGNIYGPSSFRLGALLGLTSLKEPAGKVNFTSLLVEPSVRVRLVDRRVYLTGALGIGALFISNIKSGSALLVPPPNMMSFQAPSTITFFELRPAAGLQVHLTPAIVGSITPAISFSPKKNYFYENIGRFELLFGLSILI
jgi:hypothetical protein